MNVWLHPWQVLAWLTWWMKFLFRFLLLWRRLNLFIYFKVNWLSYELFIHTVSPFLYWVVGFLLLICKCSLYTFYFACAVSCTQLSMFVFLFLFITLEKIWSSQNCHLFRPHPCSLTLHTVIYNIKYLPQLESINNPSVFH